MSEYDVDELVDDVAPGIYDGIGDAFCPQCATLWIDDEKRFHFDCLADEVEAGTVAVRRATWRHGALDGRPELGLVVVLDDAAPLNPAQILALGQASERGGWPNFGARLIDAGLTLWVGSARISPGQPESDVAHGAWWRAHRDAVASRLVARGYPSGDDQWREVPVEVTPNQRIRLA